MPVAKKTKKAESVAEKNGGFAVIETGGKQYRVASGDIIKIEKIKGEHKEGETIIFDKVFLVDDGKGVTDIGTPYIDGAKISATLFLGVGTNGTRQKNKAMALAPIVREIMTLMAAAAPKAIFNVVKSILADADFNSNFSHSLLGNGLSLFGAVSQCLFYFFLADLFFSFSKVSEVIGDVLG